MGVKNTKEANNKLEKLETQIKAKKRQQGKKKGPSPYSRSAGDGSRDFDIRGLEPDPKYRPTNPPSSGTRLSHDRGGKTKSALQRRDSQDETEMGQSTSKHGSRPHKHNGRLPITATHTSSKASKNARLGYKTKQKLRDPDHRPDSSPRNSHSPRKQKKRNSTGRNTQRFKLTPKLTVDDFDFVKVVGRGSFAKVMMVRKKDTGKIYAMKILKKKALMKRKQIDHTRTERRVMANVDCPFIVSLRYSFQTPAKLYMILDFFNGGELFFHLKRVGRFDEDHVRFYAAEMTAALCVIHKMDIVYRDLKPENILLDADGHIRITDFGLSKDCLVGDGLTHTFCGTPEYLAPEVLQQEGHGKPVDWWSLGTLSYEMMTGLPPFYDQNLNVMYEKILTAKLTFPEYMSRRARSFFRKLLQREVSRRLGGGPSDAEDVMAHEFFEEINWDDLFQRNVTPPYIPAQELEDQHDSRFIDEEFTKETPKDTPVVTTFSVLQAKDQFPGFSYDHRGAGPATKRRGGGTFLHDSGQQGTKYR